MLTSNQVFIQMFMKLIFNLIELCATPDMGYGRVDTGTDTGKSIYIVYDLRGIKSTRRENKILIMCSILYL